MMRPHCKRLPDALQPGRHEPADRAQETDRIRGRIREQGAVDVIPSGSIRKLPKDLDAGLSSQRTKIERFFGD